ncbi:hypothetical protein Dimus_026545, partial [Dionaea muscipula]
LFSPLGSGYTECCSDRTGYKQSTEGGSYPSHPFWIARLQIFCLEPIGQERWPADSSVANWTRGVACPVMKFVSEQLAQFSRRGNRKRRDSSRDEILQEDQCEGPHKLQTEDLKPRKPERMRRIRATFSALSVTSTVTIALSVTRTQRRGSIFAGATIVSSIHPQP